MGLLEDIKRAEVGAVIQNRHGIGKREIQITKLLKKRANLAMTLKIIGRKRRRNAKNKRMVRNKPK